MNKIIKILLAALFVNISLDSTSQNETSKWYFGVNAGLDFMTNSPTVLTNGQIVGMEGCSSISDASGNLLFYSDGSTIWNSAHLPMANGTGLFGSVASTQSSIIIKQPGNSNIYFVFTQINNGTGGLSFSAVDMNLAAGMGSVTVKNSQAYWGICAEKLAATKHCNGSDIWVLSHDYNYNNFRAFLVTAAGVNTTAVVSSIGSVHVNFQGQLKFSPTGRKIGLATLFGTPFELFDFDNSTGTVSNPLVLSATLPYTYGCEFSPDGTKFYGTSMGGGLYQWDLCAGSGTAIISSIYTVNITQEFLQLQLAKNGKLYAANDQLTTIGVINNPNISGAGCNFVPNGQSVSPNQSRFALPNFVSSFFKQPIPFTANVSCLSSTFQTPISCYASTGNSITSVAWTFGDPGPTNTSTLFSPAHVYPSQGNYSVQLVVNYTCGSDTINQIVNIPSCTGIEESEQTSNRLRLFPVPVKNELTLSFDLNPIEMFGTILIYNNLGQLIKTEKIIFTNNKSKISTSNFDNGIYFLLLKNDRKTFTVRFIKEE